MDLTSLFTSDEEIGDFEDRDATTNITGYVESLTSPTLSEKKKSFLFKFVICNGSKRIEVLIWDDLINKYCKDITLNRVININGALCRAVTLPPYKKEKKFAPFEIIVKENSEITFLGYYMEERLATNTVHKATFDDIHMMEGLIEISGYVRTKFSLLHNRSGLASYGIGAITDGKKKITVQVKQFTESHLELGDYVTVKGTVKGQDSLVVIFCDSMSSIKLDPEVTSLTKEDVMRGGRPVKRIHSKI